MRKERRKESGNMDALRGEKEEKRDREHGRWKRNRLIKQTGTRRLRGGATSRDGEERSIL